MPSSVKQRSVAQIRASDTALLQNYTRAQLASGVPLAQIDLGSGTANYKGDPDVVRFALTPEDRTAFANYNAANPGNPQGAAVHPVTGELWTHEHGPQGGDEVNRTLAGRNHGWPVISHGQYYGTLTPVGEGTAKPGMEPPVSVWEMADGSTWVSGAKSSTAPSGMAFFTGSTPAHWQGSLFVGALAGRALWRLQLHGHQVVGRERLLTALGERIRDVRMGPDGHLWLLTDGSNGRLLRVSVD